MAVDKTKGRLKRNYRITWVDNGGMNGPGVNPPISPQRLSHLPADVLASEVRQDEHLETRRC